MASRTTSLGILTAVPAQPDAHDHARDRITALRTRYLLERDPGRRAQLIAELDELHSPRPVACHCGARAFVDTPTDEAGFRAQHKRCRRVRLCRTIHPRG